MEIRNQLIHNLDTDCLLKAVERCNKLNKLLAHNKALQTKFKNYDDLSIKEGVLKIAFQELYGRILDFIKKSIATVTKEIEYEEKLRAEVAQTEMLTEVIVFLGNAVDDVSNVYDDYFSNGEPDNLPQKDTIKRGIWGMFWKQVKEKYPDLLLKSKTDLKVED